MYLLTLNQSGGCQPCEKRCELCENYLLKTDKVYNPRYYCQISA